MRLRRPLGNVGLSYAAVVGAVALGLQALPGHTRTRLVLAVSTDPDRLLQHPARSLLLSAFVVPSLTGLWLLPGTVLAVGGVQRAFGARSAVLAGAAGHVAVSVIVAVLLERADDAPVTAASADVGVSYVLAVTAGLALSTATRWWLLMGATGGTAVTGGLLVAGRTSTDAGHLLAWLLGLAAALVTRGQRPRPGPENSGLEQTCWT